MTKKGALLTIILVWILILIGIVIYRQNKNTNIDRPENLQVNEGNMQEELLE